MGHHPECGYCGVDHDSRVDCKTAVTPLEPPKAPGDGTAGITRWPRKRRPSKNVRLTELEQIEVITALRFLMDWRRTQARRAAVPLEEALELINSGIIGKITNTTLPKKL